ncbi:uncharacterized protein N7511_000964 [Penicillium nucicola]|uniref:uncharacterized protein n=1 Tax=Penicillium nucicola TaxID=1850975 RepID=UPI00254584F1|nr:uncharacterized protein N7511_000964 [Penicillium nucicola]KAJ5775953.1 hypothetical protein N7511_000964 [Penicillium nucicola]
MSVNENRHTQNITNAQATSSPSLDREALDQRLKRLSEEVLPSVPYLLTLPTNSPFRQGNRREYHWAVGHDRPFRSEEQELQYMTFLAHHDTDSLLVAVGDWSDDTGRMMDDRPTAPSTTESPRESVARKKISLKDYKHQKINGPVASPMGPESSGRSTSDLNQSEEKRRTASSEPLKNPDRVEAPQMPLKADTRLSPERVGQKRPSGSDRELLNPRGTKDPATHSLKKPRLSSSKEYRRDPSPSKSHSPKLPALLSPTLPPTSNGPKLPRLLSPTLPPDIEKELARLDYSSPPHNSRPGASEKTLPEKDSNIHDQPKENARPGVPKVQLIAKLRYGRANRKRVEALLKFSGKMKTRRSDSPVNHDTDRDDASHSRKKGAETTGSFRGNALPGSLKNKTKPETDEALGPHDSRSREPKGLAEKTRTPLSQPLAASLPQEKAKQAATTPRDRKTSAPRRIDLGESDGKTPSHPANKRHSVDTGTVAKASPSQSDSRSRERRAWRDEWQKFSTIGRELKHAADRHNSKNGASSVDEKLAAVVAIEALLSFILAFVADDQSKAVSRQVGDSSTWLSIIPYWKVVKKLTSPYPALSNLCLLLGAVSFNAIHALDLERLAISPIPGEHTPVPTPGSDTNTNLSDETKKVRKEFLDLKNRLPECYKESQRLWLEGTRGLSEDILAREFPTSWSQRSRNYSERGRTSLKAGDYSGSFFLPLGGTTPPIEVVRFGGTLLKEWCSKEQVEWNGRLGI